MYLTLLKALKEKQHTAAQQQYEVAGLSSSTWLVLKDWESSEHYILIPQMNCNAFKTNKSWW